MNALTQQEKKLIRLLPEDGTRPISNQKLATLMDLQPRVIWALVYGLITRHGCPIGFSHDPAGYFWITSDDELELALRPIASQTREIQRRLAGLRRAKAISKDEALAEPTADDKKAKEA